MNRGDLLRATGAIHQPPRLRHAEFVRENLLAMAAGFIVLGLLGCALGYLLYLIAGFFMGGVS